VLPATATTPANTPRLTVPCALRLLQYVVTQLMLYPNQVSVPLMPNYGVADEPKGMLHIRWGRLAAAGQLACTPHQLAAARPSAPRPSGATSS